MMDMVVEGVLRELLRNYSARLLVLLLWDCWVSGAGQVGVYRELFGGYAHYKRLCVVMGLLRADGVVGYRKVHCLL